jgi:hypothetical protein
LKEVEEKGEKLKVLTFGWEQILATVAAMDKLSHSRIPTPNWLYKPLLNCHVPDVKLNLPPLESNEPAPPTVVFSHSLFSDALDSTCFSRRWADAGLTTYVFDHIDGSSKVTKFMKNGAL